MVKIVIYPCPRCSSTQVWRFGRDRKGRQLFKCRLCGRVYTKLSRKMAAFKGNLPLCPKCGETQLFYRHGRLRDGRQRWHCLSCGRHFSELSERSKRFAEKTKLASDLLTEGLPVKAISRILGVSLSTVYKIRRQALSSGQEKERE